MAEVPGSGSESYVDGGLTNGQEYCYEVTSSYPDCESGFSNILCATPEAPGQTVLVGVSQLVTRHYVTSGKGKNVTVVFEPAASFPAGEAVGIWA